VLPYLFLLFIIYSFFLLTRLEFRDRLKPSQLVISNCTAVSLLHADCSGAKAGGTGKHGHIFIIKIVKPTTLPACWKGGSVFMYPERPEGRPNA